MTQAIVITYSVFPPCRSRNQTEYFPDLSFAVGLNVFEWLTVSAGKMVMSYESIWIPLRLRDKMRFLKLVSNLVAVSLQPAFQGCRLPLHPHLGHDDEYCQDDLFFLDDTLPCPPQHEARQSCFRAGQKIVKTFQPLLFPLQTKESIPLPEVHRSFGRSRQHG